MNKERLFLEHKAYNMRMNVLTMTSMAGSGHPTSCLSAADLVSAIFFHAMRYDAQNPENPNNDRFILSKGHAAPLLYAAWKEVGVITEKELLSYRSIHSPLEGHPTMRFPYTEAATGALGIGLSIGVGMALDARLHNLDYKTYVLLGDGEIAEGCVWEAAELAHFNKLHNIIAIIDANRLGQSAETVHGYHLHRYEEKFAAFGWKTFVIDGHNMQQIVDALDKAKEVENIPVVIIAKTIKGCGVKSVEGKLGFHGKVFAKEELNTIFKELDERYPEAVSFDEKMFKWQFPLPDQTDYHIKKDEIALHESTFAMNDMLATRKAYGMALRELGGRSNRVVALDGEVKNSTFSDMFEEKFPERFFQCFIAEQNMIGMATGLEKRGNIPFASSFGAFMSRAHDQIRMAAIGSAALRLVGSHAGVSIGQDGPSQMALEDIAMMRSLPSSAILYPCDAVSTWKLVEQMANYNDGISYLRTTRMETPIIYENSQLFEIGGCSVLRQHKNDSACVVAAGITLHEALKACEILQQEGISISVIDLYSIKPLDVHTLIEMGRRAGNRMITVEDHYLEGGLGEAVTCAVEDSEIIVQSLAVTELPRSGKPEELLSWANIDAAAIVKAVKKR